MAFLVILCAAYVVVVVLVRKAKRSSAAQAAPLPALPADDQPPPDAVGWPPEGSGFPTYVDEGFAALDAYLSEGFAP